MATSHPERAPSAADVEKALGGIDYPKVKRELVSHASQKVSNKDLLSLLQSLPDRIYRDSAEVAIALGEVKRAQGIRASEEIAAEEPPSVKGGRAAATSVSAATVAKVLSGVDFPKNKGELRDYAQKHMTEVKIADPQGIIGVIDKLPDREYENMADVEKSVGQVL
jgi:hypothetical protein